MKKQVIIICLLIISTTVSFAQKASDHLEGNWKTPQGKIIVISGNAQQGFTGTVQNKAITVLKDIRFSAGKWKGTIIKPGDGSEAACELRVHGDILLITAKKGIFSKEITWQRL